MRDEKFGAWSNRSCCKGGERLEPIMTEPGKRVSPKWWMGRVFFFRAFYGSAIIVLAGLSMVANNDADLTDLTASGWFPPPIIIAGIVVFAGLLALSFLVYWARRRCELVFGASWRLLPWLFRWRMVPRYMCALAVVSLLLGLFYAEEDWRGKRDWENYKRAAESKGERFDLSAFDPPAVPDDQNFAFAPIVSNTCITHAVWNGEMFQEKTNAAGPRLDARLYARSDWNPWPNNSPDGDWQIGKKIDLKGFQDYYRVPVALNWRTNQRAGYSRRSGRRGRYGQPPPIPNRGEVPTNEFPVAAQPQSPAADVLLALSKFDAEIEQLREASGRPYCRFPSSGIQKDTNQQVTVNLTSLRDCTAVLRLRAVAELELGQGEKAFADVRVILRLASFTNGAGWVRPELNSALQPIWEGLVSHKWSGPELMGIEDELARFDLLAEYQFAVRRRCAEPIEEIDSIARRRAHEFWKSMRVDDPDGRSLLRIFCEEEWFVLIPKGWFYENDTAAAQMCQEAFQTEAEVKRRNISGEMAHRIMRARVDDYQHRSPNNFIASSFLSYDLSARVSRTFALAQNYLDEARVACALERYRLANGEYPGSLDALAPQFIEKIPHDVINAQPLHYRRMDDGQFLLYSVGWNGKDDGGITPPRKNPEYRAFISVDEAAGDWVWPKPEKQALR